MKTEVEVKEQLKEVYEYRLGLRISRKEKNSCKNCKYGNIQTLDLGEFGDYTKYGCIKGYENKCNGCNLFECKYNREDIENEMIEDIKDPSICGSKEPKIAALMWVLHNDSSKKKEEKKETNFGKKILTKIFGLGE